jgi:hypothetical protein
MPGQDKLVHLRLGFDSLGLLGQVRTYYVTLGQVNKGQGRLEQVRQGYVRLVLEMLC